MGFSEVIDKYRTISGNGKPASFRQFAEQVNADLPRDHYYRPEHWYAVARGTYRPNFYLLFYLNQFATGWVRDFAADMLAALEGKA